MKSPWKEEIEEQLADARVELTRAVARVNTLEQVLERGQRVRAPKTPAAPVLPLDGGAE